MQFALQAGLVLRYGQRTIELVRELEGGEYVLEDVVTRKSHAETREELIANIYKKKYEVVLGDTPLVVDLKRWPAVVDLSSLTKRERKLLDYRLDYIKRLRRLRISRGQRNRVAGAINAFAAARNEKAPSASAVMKWMRDYEQSGNNPLALVDKHRTRKTLKRKCENVEKLIWRVLKKHYFTKAQNSIKFAHDKLTIELQRAVGANEIAADVANVSYQTLSRRVESVDLYHRIASREGPQRARIECRTSFPDGVATYPYQRVQIDHTMLNWVVICDRTGLPLGRPTLTVMIDAYSGYVLGFYLSFYGPGLTSVCGVVRNALMPKRHLLKGLDLTHDWLSYGLGDEWVIDNGLEFHSFGFRTMAMALGVDVMYCRVRTPWLKPHVERFFATLNTLTLQKGRVRKASPNILRIDPYTDAAINFSDLVNGLLMYVVDVHPHETNWRKLTTPFELFHEGIKRSPPAVFPGNLDQLALAAGMSKMLTFGPGGIELYGLPYGSYAFKNLAKKHGTGFKLLCKWDPDDMLGLRVQDPDGITWHEATCRWSQYADGLSFNQHRLIGKFAREKLKNKDRLESLLNARMRLHDHWQNATQSRKRADALTAARYADVTSHKVLTQSVDSPSIVLPQPKQLILPATQIVEREIPEFESIAF